jgi:hypothetical protein
LFEQNCELESKLRWVTNKRHHSQSD